MPKNIRYEQLVKQFTWEEAFETYDADPNIFFNTAHECCDRWADNPEQVAIYWENQAGEKKTWTYKDLKEKSDKLANGFRSLGVEKGERIACLLGKDIELVLTALAAWKIGAIYLPLFTAFGPEAISHRLSISESKVLITNKDQSKKLDNLDFSGKVILIDHDSPSNKSFWQLLNNASPQHITEKTKLTDPSVIQFTSGSTGMPKGAVWAHKILISVYPYTKYAIGLNKNDIFLGGADPGWAYGFINSIISPLSFGVPIVMYKGSFEAAKYYELMERYKVTSFAYAPTAYRMMKAAGEELVKNYNFHVKKFSSAGEPLNAEVIRFFKNNFGQEIYDHYGCTETNMLVNNYHAVSMTVKPGSMGFPTPGYKVDIINESGDPVQIGEVGQIAVDATGFPFNFLGYWKEPEKTEEKRLKNWFLTGDLALKDEEGYYWFQGRSDDIISSAGYRIGPFEVESCLLEHPAVTEAAVIGKPDSLKGEIVKAYVVLGNDYPESSSLAEEISNYVKTKLSKHQYPKEVEFIKQLPKTSSGKIQRFLLRKEEQAQ
ncbi:acyl-CoA synthetase [Alteribacillus sp. JSM 102045]|uniref:acyl-CoA synthetase n=1 Tax=Alteribacillus sp. JSM 102045 TaxID=1562101 RepID=UPI0035BF315E